MIMDKLEYVYTQAAMDQMFKLGPKEMQGEIWDEKGRYEVVEILISHQPDLINSIRFSYRTAEEKVIHSKTYGEPTGLKFDMVEFDSSGEVLTSLSGTLKDGRLASIVFGTNKRKYGPFGRTGDKSSCSPYEDFEYKFKPGRFGGFHGSVVDGSVYAIGAYVKPYMVYDLDDVCDALTDNLWL
uniref:Lectin protein n=1 Tax=Helianthus tuberosus TaxID=4233 RepID=A0A7D3QQK6_HELTU|nr:lectin protein [Helianthus tuberosus]